jgi:hypothetical protein
MSIEKELLKRMRDVLRGLEETHYDLYWDIQSELEKIEHKHNNVGYLYKQKDCYGEIETVFSFDKPYITWHNVTDVIPVYLAPQKREPFGPEIRERMSKAYNTKCEQIAFQEGIVFAEISHGIGAVDERH